MTEPRQRWFQVRSAEDERPWCDLDDETRELANRAVREALMAFEERPWHRKVWDQVVGLFSRGP